MGSSCIAQKVWGEEEILDGMLLQVSLAPPDLQQEEEDVTFL